MQGSPWLQLPLSSLPLSTLMLGATVILLLCTPPSFRTPNCPGCSAEGPDRSLGVPGHYPLCTGGSPDIIVHVERALVLPPPVDRREVTSTSGTTLAGPFGSGMVLAICLSMVMHPTWNKNINFCVVANNKSKIPGNVGTGSKRAGLVDHTDHVLRVLVREINRRTLPLGSQFGQIPM